ncbi:hypothetical protein CHUAL_003598 [Chamberlinius hualienensis]
MPNRSSFVVARVIERPYGFLNFALAIEDENADIIMLELFNVPVTEIPQVGQVIIIKEPYYKCTIRQLPAIRCDSPTDITVLQRNHVLYSEIQWKNEIHCPEFIDFFSCKPASEWFQEGRRLAVNNMNMVDAISCFTIGMSLGNFTVVEWSWIKSEMYLIYKKHRYFETAEEFALQFLNELPFCTEALISIIEARYSLHKYQEAYSFAFKYWDILKHVKKVGLFLGNIIRVYEEYRDVEMASYIVTEKIDYNGMPCHESISNFLKLNKKRNVVAKKRIPQCVPIIVAHPSVIRKVSQRSHLFFNYKNYDEISDCWLITRRLVLRIYQNPNTYFKQIFGFRSSVSNDEPPPNMYCSENLKELAIDVERIKDISRTNTFIMSDEEEDGIFMGLYDYPSYLKHSCQPNASYKFYNGVMLVKTLQAIKKNYLVTIDYAQFETDPQKRRALLSRRSERVYDINDKYCRNVLIPLATDMESYSYARRGTKMTISMDQMQEIRTLLQKRANLQNAFNNKNLDDIGHCIETFHSKVYTSSAPLASLKRATFGDLRLEMPNRNSYVVARVIERSYGYLNFSLAIEDENGDVIMLELVNFPVTEIPCMGQVIIIKEPYYKLTTRQLPAIRCDSPTDLTILQISHALYREIETIQWKNEIQGAELVDFSSCKPASEWLKEGRRQFTSRMNMTDAINCFSIGISVSNFSGVEWNGIKREMYLLYYTQRYFEKAEEFALNFLSELPSCAEALVFIIQARYGLHKYQEAYRFAMKHRNILKHAGDFLRTIMRVYEEYIDIQMASYIVIQKVNYNDMPCHESKSNLLELNKKRNVVAKSKIPQYYPVIVSRPSFIQKVSHPYHLFFNYKNYDETGDNWLLTRGLVLGIYKNPNTYFKQIFGFRNSVSSDEPPPNMYCGENSTELAIDVERIKDISRTNTFIVRDEEEDGIFLGLYDYPSYLKHSCQPNASYMVYNGVMLVRTIKAIRKNQFVTIDYAQFETDPQKRRTLLSRRSERFYNINNNYCQKVVEPLAHEMESYAYVRRGTKMNISNDQMKEVRALLQYRANLQKTFNEPNLTHIGHCIETFHGKVYTSTAPLASLKRTTFRDLRLEMPNRSFYVMARVIEQPYGYSNFALGIEDEHGDVIMLELVNIPGLEIPLVGQVIVIKEPYYKLTTRELPAIRCDSPTDITVLQRNHLLYREIETIRWKNEIHGSELVDFSSSKSGKEWLKEGRKLSKKRINMADAIRCFVECLNVSVAGKDDWIWCKRHIYWFYQRDGYYEKACESAIDFRNRFPSNSVAVYLLAQCYLYLQKYKEAYYCAKKGRNEETATMTDFYKLVKRTYEEYKNVAIAYACAICDNHRCSESKSPFLELNENLNVVTNSRILPNVPIIVAHPLAIQKLDIPFKLFFNYKYYEEPADSWLLVRGIIFKIYKNPNTYFNQFFSFRSSVSNSNAPPSMYCDEHSGELTVDVEKIKDICRTNTFTMIWEDRDEVIGVFGYPSYLKHSCHPNATYRFINGVMLVKTLKTINKNHLVTIDYAQSETDPQKRRALMSRRSVVCNCPKCDPKD